MSLSTALYRGMLAAWAAEFTLLMAWYLWLAPPPPGLRTPLLLIIVAPWLLPLPGLLHGRRYTIAWSSLLVLGYFIHGVFSAAGAPPEQWLGAAEIVTVLAYFACATLLMRTTRAGTSSNSSPDGYQ